MDSALISKCGMTSVAIAVSLALGTVQSLAAPPTAPISASSKVEEYKGQSFSISGPILVGPVESIAADRSSITVLGRIVNVAYDRADFLPAQYVAVFGSVGIDGEIKVDFIQDLDRVYSPGSSTVLIAGMITRDPASSFTASVDGIDFQTIEIAALDGWSSASFNSMGLVIGTQPALGAPIFPDAIVFCDGPGTVELTDIGIEQLAGIAIHARIGADFVSGRVAETGLSGLSRSSTIVNERFLSMVKGIDGSGIIIQGIDGSGYSPMGIDGSGYSPMGIDGSGYSPMGIDGSGYSPMGIDGSGIAPLRADSPDPTI